jgi:Spy/CpxP family protein refolding chaperone
MNKKLFLVPVAIILAVAAGLAGTVYAQGAGPGFGFGRHGGWMLKHMAKQLNLTDAQQAQIRTIMQGERPKIQPLMQQLRQNEQAQNAAITGDFNEAQARAFAQKQTQIMNDLIVEKQRVKSQIYAVLTPEQRQKAIQLMQQREQRHQERMQKKSQQQAQPNQ